MLAVDPPQEFLADFDSLELCSKAGICCDLESEDIKLPPKCKRGVFRGHEVEQLQVILSKLYDSTDVSAIDVNSMHLSYEYIELRDRRFSSCLTNDYHHCVALVEWKVHLFGTPPTPLPEPYHPNKHFHPARID